MMNYEEEILKLKEEMRHERELRRGQSLHLIAHDASISIAAIREILAENAVQMQEMQGIVRETQTMLKTLIDSLVRGRQNGGGEQK